MAHNASMATSDPASSSPSSAAADLGLDPLLLELVACPDCHGALAVDVAESALMCTACGLAYPVRDRIPVLLVDEARRPS